jgi:hypothetical protein
MLLSSAQFSVSSLRGWSAVAGEASPGQLSMNSLEISLMPAESHLQSLDAQLQPQPALGSEGAQSISYDPFHPELNSSPALPSAQQLDF